MLKVTVFVICSLVVALHVFVAVSTNDASWVSRSGSSFVAVGLLLESWKIITTPLADDMPFWSSQSGHSALRTSVLIIIVGTLIQGYGDLVFTKIRLLVNIL